MTIVGSSSSGDPDVAATSSSENGDLNKDQSRSPKGPEKEEKDNPFSGENLGKSTEVPNEEVESGSVIGLEPQKKDITITAQDKISFIDAIVNNKRYERDYSLFGGKVNLTIRSLTSEEVQALSVWILKHGTSDPTWQITGSYRKYLLAAQVARYNGIEMPPLEQPLFDTLEKDGKTVRQVGWIDRGKFWDDKPSGIISAISACLSDFDVRYTTLCKKAEDSNFWNPDTP